MIEIAIPSAASSDVLNTHQFVWLTLVARLKPGVTPAQAEAGVAPLWHNLRASELPLYKSTSDQFKKHFLDDSQLKVVDDSSGFSPERLDLKTPLIILMSMAGLLIAMCAINVATLLLLRAAARAREMSMRYALGAKRSQIVSQLLLEGGLLGLIGATTGLALAPLATRTLLRLLASATPGDQPYSAAIDTHMLLFTLGIALVVSLLFSMAPVLHFLRPDLANALRQSSGTASRNSQRFRKLAVGVQIALSVLLLGGAGLFVRTLNNLRHQQVGFVTEHLATFSLDPTDSGYAADRTSQVVTDALRAVRQIPGIASATATTDPELAGNSATNDFAAEGHTKTEEQRVHGETSWITPRYFATLQQPLLAGRDFSDADRSGSPKVAIVNLTVAKRFYGSAQNALGHRIGQEPASGAARTWAASVILRPLIPAGASRVGAVLLSTVNGSPMARSDVAPTGMSRSAPRASNCGKVARSSALYIAAMGTPSSWSLRSHSIMDQPASSADRWASSSSARSIRAAPSAKASVQAGESIARANAVHWWSSMTEMRTSPSRHR